MEIVITEAERIGALVADEVQALLERRPDAVLGLATGSSPLRAYDVLAARVAAGTVSFAGARGFMLDEYVGLPADDPRSYRSVIDAELVSRVDFAPGAVLGPDGTASDLDAACAAYEREVAAAGGVDLQILGVGTTGHIAFNEPSSSLASRTRVKTLTAQTRRDNARFFDGDVDAVPRHCLTQGLGTILESRHAVVIATGFAKAVAVREMVEGAISARWPCTALQLHPKVTVLVDQAAASGLELTDYYREVAEHRDAVR
ncbi:glucosamine-6-phosphate deaminase [Agrococcus beijingensis]|uniref:glucosamine-6-phosphate deaminase n=1 Tax=Agrococcus beijingensis TaxID=3068634 RepID=UPI002740AE5A|nr:glucosamine-6-phosphate deaminase [Agrococcus sp. REN33]